MSRAGAGGPGPTVSGGRPTRIRYPGEAFGLAPGAGQGVRRAQPVDVEQIATLRAWSLRLRVAATALSHLAAIVLTGCTQAGLVGPAGDALQQLGAEVAHRAAEAADEAGAAADQLDRHAAALLMAPADPGAPPADQRLTGRRLSQPVG